MNKKLLFSVLIGIIVLFITIYSALAFDQEADIYLTFDNNTLSDSYGNYSSSGNTAYVSGILNNGADFDGTQYIRTAGTTTLRNSLPLTINFWINPDSYTNGAGIISSRNGNVIDMDIFQQTSSPGRVFFRFYGTGGSANEGAINGIATSGSWTMITIIVNDLSSFTGIKIYKNGVDQNYVSSFTSSGTIKTDVTYTDFGNEAGVYFNGKLDEFGIWRGYAFNQSEIDELYNSGAPDLQPPFVAPPPSNFTVTAFNIFNNESVENFTAEINSVNYSAVSGVAETGLLNNDTANYTLKIWSPYDIRGALFNASFYNVSPSLNNKNVYLLQSDVKFESYEMFSNISTGAIKKVNDSFFTFMIPYLSAGNYNFTSTESISGVYNRTFFQKDLIYYIPPLYNGTVQIDNISSGRLNITVKNAYTGLNLSNFYGWVYYNATGGNNSFNSSGASSVLMDLIEGDFYVFVYAEGYSLNEDNYKTVSITDPLNYTSFSLFSSNSLLVTIRDEVTGNLITQNVTLTLTGDTEYINYTSTGSIFYENLTDGNYSLKLQADNYTLRTYTVTVADLSSQTLTAYLTSEASKVLFTILDFSSSAVIPGVSITMSKLVNSSWTVIESKTSDITGRAQLTYVRGVKYKFDVSAPDYQTKTFYLDPILFDSYNVRLSKSVTLVNASEGIGVSVSYNPTYFYSSYENNFTFSIYSGGVGSLEWYNWSLYYPSGVLAYSGTNAIGENWIVSFNMTGANFRDTVNLSYCYNSTLDTLTRCYSSQYNILDAYSSTSWLSNKDNTYGLGLFERIIITAVLIVVVSGLIGIVAGAVGGGLMALLLMSFFVGIGFIPLWSILISMIIGLFILIRRSE